MSMFPCLYSRVHIPMSIFPCLYSHVYIPMSIFPSLYFYIYIPVFRFLCTYSHIYIPISIFPYLYSRIYIPVSIFHVHIPISICPTYNIQSIQLTALCGLGQSLFAAKSSLNTEGLNRLIKYIILNTISINKFRPKAF